MKRIILCILLSLLIESELTAKTVYICRNDDLNYICKTEKTKYIIQFEHQFKDTLYVPKNCELFFEGGHLCGPIVFYNTKLGGNVNLKGSSISGNVHNTFFDASWLCAMDGESDDAKSINEIINVCGNIFFPKGRYLLLSFFNPQGKIDEYFYGSVECHIGIYKNDIVLRGEEGTEMLIEKPSSGICVFSKPNQIENSVRNIVISGITFRVKNDGENFHEFAHTIKMKGVNNITIKDCVFDDFWGDAICLSHYYDTPETGERTRNQNIKILRNTIKGGEHYNNRNGISIGNGKNVLIKGNIIKNTSRKDMPGGIDIEPNNSAYTIDNIKIIDNYIEYVKGMIGAICVVIPRNAPAHNISILNNTIKNCSWGISVCVSSEKSTSNFIIAGNNTDDKTVPYRFCDRGSSRNWIIKNNIWGRPCRQIIPGNIKVENLVLKNNKKKE